MTPDERGRALRYAAIVKSFQALTGATWPLSGRCCERTRQGAPECCYQIVDGADLTFTVAEREILISQGGAFGVLDFALRADDGMFVLDREVWAPPSRIEQSLNGGPLANTLECASHPTRPIVAPSGKVAGVALLLHCNGRVALDHYRKERAALEALWEAAVALVGVKPYYVTERLRDDMLLL